MPCIICNKSKRWYHTILTLPCGHRFHYTCYSNLNPSKCPECFIISNEIKINYKLVNSDHQNIE